MADTGTGSEPLLCRRCGLAVVVCADTYDVLEQMHWVCFHYVYEHQGDPDAGCADPSCPTAALDARRAAT